MKFTQILFVTIISAAINFAQTEVSKEPGYFDFGDLSEFQSGDEITEVFLEENILKMVGKLTKEEEPELSQLINGLKLIKVNIFGFENKNEAQVKEKMNEADKKLISSKWNRIVKTKEGGEQTNVYIKTSSGGNVLGLVITIIQDDGEASFINIVGNIDLEKIGELSKKFDIPEIGEFKKEKSKRTTTEEK